MLYDSHNVGSSVRLTIASLAGQVTKCQCSVQSLQSASKYVSPQHAVQLQRCLNQLNAKLKIEWISLLDHLNEALAFTNDVFEEFPDEYAEERVRRLKETSQIVVDKHARVSEMFTSQRDVISILLKPSWSPSKRRRLRSTANHVLGRTQCEDQSDQRLVAFVEGGLDSAHADGQVALCGLEESLGELGTSVDRLSSFWKFFSTEALDREGLSSAIDSVSLSIDSLVPVPRQLHRRHFGFRKWV
jgi:hypothetical protein